MGQPGFPGRLLRRPLNQLLLGAFVLVALVPLTLLGVRLYHAAWDDAWREIHEKHRLLAMNLASPLQLYVKDHQTMLAMLANRLGEHPTDSEIVDLLQDSSTILPDFRNLSLLSRDGELVYTTALSTIAPGQRRLFARDQVFLDTLEQGRPCLSRMRYSPLTDEPTILMSQPITDERGHIKAVLLAELNIAYIEQLRRNIHFGDRGHSAIVDQSGHVIAHPNPDWMREIRDLSHLSVVRKMMAGKTGVTEFYSPFVKQDMVAGYTSVPGIGWGVMVPQPKAEVARQVNALLYTNLGWAVAGLLLAIGMAVFMARVISRPLRQLATAADGMVRNRFRGELPSPGRNVPREIAQLDDALHNLISGLLISRHRLEQLNENLQHRVDEATARLRETNEQLEAALRRADEFIGFARHDLRKPLAVIRDIIDTLHDELRITGKPPADLPELLDLIRRSDDYMQDIVNDFLGEIVLHEDSITCEPVAVDLNLLIRFIVTSNRAYAERKQIALHTELDEHLPEIRADDTRITQVINNLVDNAIKYAPHGSAVTIRTRHTGNRICCEVTDEGPGLTDTDMEKVFTRFARLSNRPTGGETSTGLGLAICRRIVELHGGEIGVTNNPGKGCTFWFCLPVGER